MHLIWVYQGDTPGGLSEEKEQIMQQRGIMNRTGVIAGACLAVCISSTVSAQSYLVDFGPSSTPTASPDSNGNIWNNFSPGQFIRVADTTGAFPGGTIAAGIGMGLTTGAGTSALPDEGLLAPDAGLLGDLAVETATQDHMFVFDFDGSATMGIEFSSVDPTASFTFRFLSTRAGVAGETGFEVVGASTQSATINHESNADTLAEFTGVQAAVDGTISVTLTAPTGDFMFINALEIVTEGDNPGGSGCDFAKGTAFLIDTGPLFIAGSPATTQGPDANGNLWNNFSPGQFIRVLDTDGQAAASTIVEGIGFGATTGLGSSVLADEGLLMPSPALLCDLAVESATQDHIFVFDFSGSSILGLEFSSVDPETSFTVSLLGTRNGVSGETAYEINGATTQTGSVEHTNNDDTLVVFEGVQSNPVDGTIQLTLSAGSGEFMFLNAIKLEIEGGAGEPGCNIADIAEPFDILDLGDINAFVVGFTTQDPVADVDGNGIFDLGDINAYVAAFTGGCP